MSDEPDYAPLIEEFKKSGQMPLLWQWTAREFVCSANILRNAAQNSLFPDADHLWKPKSAVWLLYGLALENLVKGLLVAQGIDATSTGELNKSLKTHHLVKLWKRAGLPVSDPTDEILKNLHWSVEVGKYPVGTKPDPEAPTPFWIALMNVQAVVNLIEIAEDALRAKRPEGTFEKRSLFDLCAGVQHAAALDGREVDKCAAAGEPRSLGRRGLVRHERRPVGSDNQQDRGSIVPLPALRQGHSRA